MPYDLPTDRIPADKAAQDAAREAGLTYSDDSQPGFTRRRAGRGFAYYDSDGALITCARTRGRCNALAIPPAYRDVWICADPRGHLQATGRDARGRKTYRYHDRWREIRDRHKFADLVDFGLALSAARDANDANRRRRKLTRERVLAGVFFLLDKQALRIGSPVYAHENGSYGLTTLTDDQVSIERHDIDIAFTAKGGREVEIHLSDRRLETLIKRMSQLPGQSLFRYVEEGSVHHVTSSEVNDYLRALFAVPVTARQFRTWAGCVAALGHALEGEAPSVTSTLAAAAARLHNTPAVCRKSYVHPRIVEALKEDSLGEMMEEARRAMPRQVARQKRLSATEKLFLTALQTGLLSQEA